MFSLSLTNMAVGKPGNCCLSQLSSDIKMYIYKINTSFVSTEIMIVHLHIRKKLVIIRYDT